VIKRFLEWIRVKESLDGNRTKPPIFREGQIWWCHIGENVGHELNGKGKNFTRPIYIVKKYDKKTFLGLPLSTKEKTGIWYAPIRFRNINQTILLSQARTTDYRRLREQIGELRNPDQERLKKLFLDLHS
jgi:mRNA interferase MazF